MAYNTEIVSSRYYLIYMIGQWIMNHWNIDNGIPDITCLQTSWRQTLNRSIFRHIPETVHGQCTAKRAWCKRIHPNKKRLKQSRLAQFLRRLTTLTSVLQDKALRIMLVLTALYPTQSRLWSYVKDQKKCHKETCRAQVKHTHRAYQHQHFYT